MAHGDDIVTVHLVTLDAGCDRLLRQCLRRGLDVAWRRDRPLVVVDHKDHWRPPHTGQVHGFVEIALGRAAVSNDADSHARFATQSERIGNLPRGKLGCRSEHNWGNPSAGLKNRCHARHHSNTRGIPPS